jgi:uncharacterized protein YjiS (DUF1127 family)
MARNVCETCGSNIGECIDMCTERDSYTIACLVSELDAAKKALASANATIEMARRDMNVFIMDARRSSELWAKEVTRSSLAENEVRALEIELDETKRQIVSGFYEDETPLYTQGTPTMELQSVMTADECNGLVAKLRESWLQNKRTRELLKECSNDLLSMINGKYKLPDGSISVENKAAYNRDLIIITAVRRYFASASPGAIQEAENVKVL